MRFKTNLKMKNDSESHNNKKNCSELKKKSPYKTLKSIKINMKYFTTSFTFIMRPYFVTGYSTSKKYI